MLGENLILGNFLSEKEAVQHWMDSPGHRANILNNRFTEIGVAFIKGQYQGDTVWIGVQEIENTNSKSSRYNVLVDEYNALVASYNPLNQETKNLIFQYNSQVNNFNQCVAGK